MAKKTEVIAPVRRRLSDLYKIGKEVSFDLPGEDEPLVVWVQKLTPAEEKIAVTKARPAKAKIATIKRLPEDSDEKFYYYDKLDEARFDTDRKKLEYLVEEKLGEYALSVEAEIGDQDEWAKEDYLVGLQEAWNDGLKATLATNPDDPDARRVFAELQRFTEEVEEAVVNRQNQLIYEIQDLDEEELDKRVVRKLIEDDSSQEMYSEFRKWQVYLATRYGDDHNERYFEDRDELERTDFSIYIKLLSAYIDINVDGVEGKD